MDIFSQAVADTATIHVKDAAGEPLYTDADRKIPVQIEIWGPGSDAAGIVESRQTARSVKRLQDNDGRYTAVAPEDALKDAAEDLATLTRRFINFSYSPAGDAEGAELFQAVYLDRKLGFIKKQVQQAFADWGKFKAASAAN
jgi:hypothetical protein